MSEHIITGGKCIGKRIMAARHIMEHVSPPYDYQVYPDKYLCVNSFDGKKMLLACTKTETILEYIKLLEQLTKK